MSSASILVKWTMIGCSLLESLTWRAIQILIIWRIVMISIRCSFRWEIDCKANHRWNIERICVSNHSSRTFDSNDDESIYTFHRGERFKIEGFSLKPIRFESFRRIQFDSSPKRPPNSHQLARQWDLITGFRSNQRSLIIYRVDLRGRRRCHQQNAWTRATLHTAGPN